MPLAPTKFREEGVGHDALTSSWRKDSPITAKNVSAVMRQKYASYIKHFQENERIYANVRVAHGLPPKPRYLISDVGLVSNNGINANTFSWVYLPPCGGAFTVFPQGTIRPWTYIFIHSFGHTWDNPQMGIGKHAKGKRGLTSLMYPPGDEYGHNPSRWFSGIKQLTRNIELDPPKEKTQKVSIHFCISRRGDVMVSTDLNDMARHGGGGILKGRGAILHPHGNNLVSVGFELEPQLMRLVPNGATYVAPFTKIQMTALAIVCKKLTTFRPVKRVYITRRNSTNHADYAQTAVLADKHGSGYVQHSDVSPVTIDSTGKPQGGKTDAGAQFNILPGQKARIGSQVWQGTGVNANNGNGPYMESGWTELWNLMDKIRRQFRLADEVFVESIPQFEFKLLGEFASVLQQSNAGEKAVVTALQDRINALARAAGLQSQKRRATYAAASAHGSALSTTVTRTAAAVTRTLSAFSTADIKAPTGNMLEYNFESGYWYTGENEAGIL